MNMRFALLLLLSSNSLKFGRAERLRARSAESLERAASRGSRSRGLQSGDPDPDSSSSSPPPPSAKAPTSKGQVPGIDTPLSPCGQSGPPPPPPSKGSPSKSSPSSPPPDSDSSPVSTTSTTSGSPPASTTSGSPPASGGSKSSSKSSKGSKGGPKGGPTALGQAVCAQSAGNNATTYCSCQSCTDAVMNSMAGSFTCRQRMSNLVTSYPGAFPTYLDACLRVASVEFPQVCGACDPTTCDGRNLQPSQSTYCGCNTCTSAVWNRDSRGYTCGARITWAQIIAGSTSGSLEAACHLIASDPAFSADCGACDPATCVSQQGNPSPSMPPVTGQPSIQPYQSYRCGCPTCNAQAWGAITGYLNTGVPITCGDRIAYLEGQNMNEATACQEVGFTQFPDVCGACDPSRCSNATYVPVPAPVGTPAPVLNGFPTHAPFTVSPIGFSSSPPVLPQGTAAPVQPTTPAPVQPTTPSPASSGSFHCGCTDCTDTYWNAMADTFTCGERIMYLMAQGNTTFNNGTNTTMSNVTIIDACREVANQFPTTCGPHCNPDQCSGRVIPPFTQAPTLAPLPAVTYDSEIYCYPPYDNRTMFTAWNGIQVQVKEDPNGWVCDPNGNLFTASNVNYNNGALTLQIKKEGDWWTAAEVRMVLPNNASYTYGTYRFTLGSVAVKNSSTGAVISNQLPPGITLGMFTWGNADRYQIKERWMHEVDIEIAKWNNLDGYDAQFLVQPSYPLPSDHFIRFHTGSNGTSNPGDHTYEFLWNPTSISWYTDANGGTSLTYTTKQAIMNGETDYIQCLPASIDVRISLWNFIGVEQPVGMQDGQYVEVVVDDFIYIPSGVSGVSSGDYCSKNCQCLSGTCTSGLCQ